jgi:hypothetical protein
MAGAIMNRPSQRSLSSTATTLPPPRRPPIASASTAAISRFPPAPR